MVPQSLFVGTLSLALVFLNAGPGRAAGPYQHLYPNTYPYNIYPYYYSYHFPGPNSYYNPSLWTSWPYDPRAGGTLPLVPESADPTAHLEVKVPPGAEVWLNGSPTTSTGTVRTYQSPPLTAGDRDTYEIRVRWQDGGHEMTQTRKVAVSPGAHISVTFPLVPEGAGQAGAAKAPWPVSPQGLNELGLRQ